MQKLIIEFEVNGKGYCTDIDFDSMAVYDTFIRDEYVKHAIKKYMLERGIQGHYVLKQTFFP